MSHHQGLPLTLTKGVLVQNSRTFSLEQSDHHPACFNRGSCATLEFYHWCGHLQDFHYESTDLAPHNVSAAKFSVLLIISWLLRDGVLRKLGLLHTPLAVQSWVMTQLIQSGMQRTHRQKKESPIFPCCCQG